MINNPKIFFHLILKLVSKDFIKSDCNFPKLGQFPLIFNFAIVNF